MKSVSIREHLGHWAWLIILISTTAAVVAAGSVIPAPLILSIAVAGATILGLCVVGTQKSDRQLRRPDGVLIIAAAQLILAATILLDETVRPWCYLVVSVLTALGAIRTILFRTGARAKITEREMGILASGIAIGYFVLVLQPDQENMPTVFVHFLTPLSLSLGLFATLMLIWLATFDTSTISIPFALVLLPLSGLLILLGNPFNVGDHDWVRSFIVVSWTMPISAYLHPSTPDTFAITAGPSSQLSAGRSLSSLAVILLGPVLVGLQQFTSIELSLPTVTIASSILSVMVAVHLLLLVRRWATVEHEGQHDSLTGLPNRPLFFSRVEAAIEGAKIRESKLVVMFLDLDRFKAVNDSMGHDKGDLLLQLVSNRLSAAAARIDDNVTVSRLGGDEFAMVVPAVKDDRHAHAVGRMFLDQFLEPFDMGLRDIYVTPSIGMATFPEHGTSVKQLIENADTAMFEAKENGRNTVINYTPEHRTPALQRLHIEAGLHKAMENNELEVYYQPQIDISTGKIFSVEALIRWEHPTLGLIGPDKFVPIAEQSSLIDSIGQWTLEEAIGAAARWGPLGLPEINIAVNLSPRQFQKAAVLTDNVARALRRTGLEPSRLELELTESLALEHPEEVNATLMHFREMGIRTAIDDFGVGHTGLDYLDRIEVDTLKIDRSFINRIGESGAPLVTAVISLARGLNLDVIAEGVETRAQVDFLKRHGCRYMQGYLFSRPLSEKQLEQVLRNQIQRQNAGGAQRDAA